MTGNGRSRPHKTAGEHGRGGDPPSEAQICCCGNNNFVKIGFGANVNVTVVCKLDLRLMRLLSKMGGRDWWIGGRDWRDWRDCVFLQRVLHDCSQVTFFLKHAHKASKIIFSAADKDTLVDMSK